MPPPDRGSLLCLVALVAMQSGGEFIITEKTARETTSDVVSGLSFERDVMNNMHIRVVRPTITIDGHPPSW